MGKIPKSITQILEKLHKAGFQAYAVGGCVRDLVRGIKPKDWDIATNARPEDIQRLFPKHFYENAFGTVTVLTGDKDLSLREVEITPYRLEERYTDKRHPDKVRFTERLEDDLSRRDFTINAMALSISKSNAKPADPAIIDPFEGRNDIDKRLIRAVGDPAQRFSEDALRLMRAVRFATMFQFNIEKNTLRALKLHARLLQAISKERIRDEITKIISSPYAADGVRLLQSTGLLGHIMPELEAGVGVKQNKHHIHEVFEHNVLSLDWAARSDYNLEVRLAALLHDVAKPATKRGRGPDATFYGHEVVGARMAARILDRLRFPKRTIEKVTLLVRWHLFYYNVGEVTERSVRRLLHRVGPENINELLEVRICDRKGSGVPKAEPYKLRHLRYVIEKVSKDPLSVRQLRINGNDVMKELRIDSGPRVGYLLQALFHEVLDEPKRNKRSYLLKRLCELHKLSDSELRKISEQAKEELERRETSEEEKIKQKYWVK